MNILIVAATNFEIISERVMRNTTLITGVGMVNTSIRLTKELSKNKYDLVINMGIAGSFLDSIEIEDVVEVVEDNFAEIGFEDNLDFKRFSAFDLKTNYVVSPKTTLKKVKSITVNTVHGNDKSISEILKRENPQIETMEGAAVFKVCEEFNLDCVQIRAISNKVEIRSKDNWVFERTISKLNFEVEKFINNL